MTYPPSNPGQPPQYGPPGYDPKKKNKKEKNNKGKYVAALSVAASIATILTLFLTLGQPSPNNSPGTNGGGNATTSSSSYPVNVQTNFLNSCEANGSAQACQCTLSWLESNVSLTQFEQDEATAEQGSIPADLTSAAQACGGCIRPIGPSVAIWMLSGWACSISFAIRAGRGIASRTSR